jgi:hypothetical protein
MNARPFFHLLLLTAIGCVGYDSKATVPDASPRAISLRRDLEIGGHGDTANFFNFVNDVYVDENGDIYVTDNFDDGVRVFSSDGAFLRRFGTKGEGPDKIVYPGPLAVGNDSVFLPQGRDLRIFDTHGKWLRTVRSTVVGLIPNIAHSPAGLLVYVKKPVSVGGVARGDVWGCYAELTYDVFQLRECPIHLKMAETYSYSIGHRPLPFTPDASIALSPEGTLYGSAGKDYTIEIATPAGLSTLHGDAPRVRYCQELWIES